MKLTDHFEKLESIRDKMGGNVNHHDFSVDYREYKLDEKTLRKKGILVRSNEISVVGQYLSYSGKHLAVAYIYNSKSTFQTLRFNQPWFKSPKFHITWCKTLSDMKDYGRIARYVLSRSINNRYRMEALETEVDQIEKFGERHEVTNIRLFPCRNCLDALSYNGYSSADEEQAKVKQVEEFSVTDFLDEAEGDFFDLAQLPLESALDAKPGGYTSDFRKVSLRLREKNNWTCSKCKVNMQSKRRGLHTHHVNGVKYDNSEQNLMVLCALCHKRIDRLHNSMCIDSEVEQYIKKNRP